MRTRSYPMIPILAALVLTAAACSKNATPPPATGGEADPLTAAASPRPAKVLGLPGDSPQAAPGGRPAVLAWDVPDDWSEVPPASNMRQAQYVVPGPGGDGECIVYYFGAGQGGDPMANARRWAGQFAQPGGGDSLQAMRTWSLESAAVPVQLVEVTGTYDGGMTMTAAPAEKKQGYMLLGSIAEGADAPWFFKFTGPEPTVRAQKDAFIEMMESLRGGA